MPRQGKVQTLPFLIACLAIGGGCAGPAAPGPGKPHESGVDLSAATRPSPPAQPARIYHGAPESIYRSPKIGVVYLRAHQDFEGRLLGPQVMYQVVEPGGWNIQALESGNGYVPAMEQEAPANTANPLLVPATEVPSTPAASPLLDPDAAARITITGLMSPGDQSEAQAMANRTGGACAAVYDSQAGWLLVPVRR